MTWLQECDIDIKLVHIVKGHSLCRIVLEVLHAQEEEEQLVGWEKEFDMYNVEWAPTTLYDNSWYEEVHKYLEHGTMPSQFSML